MPPVMHAPSPCHACPPPHTPPPMHAPSHACPPVDRILDTRFWKYNLAPTSLRAVITSAIVTYKVRQARYWNCVFNGGLAYTSSNRHFGFQRKTCVPLSHANSWVKGTDILSVSLWQKVTRDAKYISSLVTFPYCLDLYDFRVARRSKLQHMREILFITYHRQKAVKVVRKGDSLPFPYVVAIGNGSKKVNPPVNWKIAAQLRSDKTAT